MIFTEIVLGKMGVGGGMDLSATAKVHLLSLFGLQLQICFPEVYVISKTKTSHVDYFFKICMHVY